MAQFTQHLNLLAEACKSTIEQMTQLNVQHMSIEKAKDRLVSLPFAHIIHYKDHTDQVDGNFILAFEDVNAALTLASSVSERLGIGKFAEISEDSTDLLNEFLNVVVGRTISEWDAIGLKVQFNTPILKLNYAVDKLSRLKSYAIILHVQSQKVHLDQEKPTVEKIILRIDFSESGDAVLENKKILIVEDSSVMRRITATALKKEGAMVKEAKDGNEAIRYYKLFKPDITLMDINMPKMNGLEAIAHIKTFDPKAKFIILSSSSRKDEILTAQTLGVVGYLVKPFDADQLIKRVKEKL